MKELVFTSDLVTGDERIDEQHRAMFSWANRILHRPDWDPRLLAKALAFVLRYVRYHFASEEDLMRRVGFPQLERHQRLHADLRARAEEIYAVALAGESPRVVMARLHALLDDWYREHISIADADVVRYLGEAGHPSDQPLPTTDEFIARGVLDESHRGVESPDPNTDSDILELVLD